jgi:DNA-binding IclR family transcriptional regulator
MKRGNALVPGLERGLKILELLALRSSQGMSNGEFQAELRFPRVSLYRLLRVLQEHNYVVQDAQSGRFRLGTAALALGFKARFAVPHNELIRPVLRELAFRTHQMAEAVTASGYWRLITLDTWQSDQSPTHILSRPGMQDPLKHVTAHGLCYLCFDGERRIGEYVSKAATVAGRGELEIRAQPTAALIEQLKNFKVLGYVWEKGSGRNIGRIAVPVYKTESTTRRLHFSLGLACEIRNLTPPIIAQWSILLKTYARKLELMTPV